MATLLIIDDELSLAEAVRDLLLDEGHRVVLAANGREGLARLAAEHFDLVVLDLMMPLLDGRELLAEIRKQPAWVHLPVIMCSAAPEMTLAQVPGATAFFTKPVDPSLLLDTIASLLRERSAGVA